MGSRVTTASCSTVRMFKGRQLHLLHHRVAIAEIGQRLDITAAKQRLIRERAAAHPFVVELPRVTRRECAVVAQALAPGARRVGGGRPAY